MPQSMTVLPSRTSSLVISPCISSPDGRLSLPHMITPSERKEWRALAYAMDMDGVRWESVSPLTPEILRINMSLNSLCYLPMKFARRVKCSKKKSPREKLGLFKIPLREPIFCVFDAVAGLHADYSAIPQSWQVV